MLHACHYIDRPHQNNHHHAIFRHGHHRRPRAQPAHHHLRDLPWHRGSKIKQGESFLPFFSKPKLNKIPFQINAGDIILSVNGESFEEINHQDAVSFLGSLRSRNQAKSDFLFIVLKPISHREIKLIWYLSLNFSYRGQIILELKSSEAVSEDDPSNLDYR